MRPCGDLEACLEGAAGRRLGSPPNTTRSGVTAKEQGVSGGLGDRMFLGGGIKARAFSLDIQQGGLGDNMGRWG